MANLSDHQFAGDARNPFGFGGDGSGNQSFNFNLGTANLLIDSTYKMFKCAKDLFITDCFLEFTDMDSHATPTLVFDVGIGSNDNAIMSAVAGSAAGSSIAMVAERIALAADDVIEFSIKVASATAVAGNVTLSFKLSARQAAA